MKTCLTCLKPLFLLFFYTQRDTALKNHSETPSERMNNHFIEMLKAHCVESPEFSFFLYTFSEDQTFFFFHLKKYALELAYSIPGGVE